ncbi:MAG TPA: hypothetical protein VKV17_10140 [Bryobacteraceae bacterium]|nr:hypothetical protein [Bryobacteraceae bacterium]
MIMQRAFLLLAIPTFLLAQYQGAHAPWIEPGSKEMLPAFDEFDNFLGKLGVLYASGPVDTTGHPFFTPLGSNGRACVNCHQPTYGMSVSTDGLQERWRATDGKDPVFAAFDGSNCPDLPQKQEKSHSLLLNRGLFRIPLPWPPRNADGSPKAVEFSIEVVRDPAGCNLSPIYGLKSAHPTVSVYRRPRPAANLKYVISGAQSIVLKTGLPADRDPETGHFVSMNLMTDAREPTLTAQALDAIMGHEEAHETPSRKQLDAIIEFESQVYAAEVEHIFAGPLIDRDGPFGLGPVALRDGRPGVPGDNGFAPVFGVFNAWKGRDYYRKSIARGADIFMSRQFWIRDVAHINSIGLGNPVKGTCATCHSAQMTGQASSAGWVDVGTTNYPTWTEPDTFTEAADLPVFKITCRPDADPHPYLGRVIYTTDPGRALISGRCADVGSIVMQQLRGLAARAPYFANGSAKNLREVVDFYDRRFDMKLTDTEKDDLVNFLGVL